MGDWIASYDEELIELLKPAKNRLPSYSTLRRALLQVNYEEYGACLTKFFNIQQVYG
ncbi:MAG: hypothetical protein ACYTX0_13060 [Nostoc sp.]